MPVDLQGEPKHFPRMPGQQADIAPGSPLAVVALFSEIVRQRFRPGNQLAWVWDDNPTDSPGQANTEDAPKKILVEPDFSRLSEARNYKPAIYVGKGDTVSQKSVIDNKAGQQIKTGLQAFWLLSTVAMDIEVVGSDRGESATIADIVWFYIVAGRDLIRSTFGLYDIGSPVLGKTLPSESDKTTFSTHIAFDVQIEFRWTTAPISPLLRSIVTKFHAAGDVDPDSFLLETYLR